MNCAADTGEVESSKVEMEREKVFHFLLLDRCDDQSDSSSHNAASRSPHTSIELSHSETARPQQAPLVLLQDSKQDQIMSGSLSSLTYSPVTK